MNTMNNQQLFMQQPMQQLTQQQLANQRQMQQALYQMSMMPLNMGQMGQLSMQQAMSLLPPYGAAALQQATQNAALPAGLWGSAFPSLHASPISTPAPSSPSSPSAKGFTTGGDWQDRVNAHMKMHAANAAGEEVTSFANIDPELISDDIRASPVRQTRRKRSSHHSNQDSSNANDPEATLNTLFSSLRRSLAQCEEVITSNPTAAADYSLPDLKIQVQSVVDKIGASRKRKHEGDGDSPARSRMKGESGESIPSYADADDDDGDDGDDDEDSRGGCKPCPLLESVPKKPIKVLYVNVQAQFTVSKKDTQKMSREDKERLVPVHVRIMGSQSRDEIYFVAKDVCLLIHTRKGNVAKSIGQFKEDEKVRMSVVCPRSNGTVSTHILTALTVKGVKRLLSTSRSPLAPHVLKWIQKQIDTIHQEWIDQKREKQSKSVDNGSSENSNNQSNSSTSVGESIPSLPVDDGEQKQEHDSSEMDDSISGHIQPTLPVTLHDTITNSA